MAYQQIAGGGLWLAPTPMLANFIANNFSSMLIDATGEKAAFLGRVWFKERTGTKDIERIGFRFGTVTKAGGSALTVSLQDVNLTTGPAGQPDETQDQTVAVANANASFATNTWIRTGALSANRTVTYGDPLAVVIEYDGSGRLGSDAVNISVHGHSTQNLLAQAALKTASWATQSQLMGVVALEFSDGTFGTLETNLPMTTLNAHTGVTSATTPDEYALPIYLPFKCKVDAASGFVLPAGGTSDFDMVLYQGTTALVTVSVDGNTISSASNRCIELPFAETELSANTQYYLSYKPTTTNAIAVYSVDVNDANHLTCWPGGVNFTYTTRTDAGAWAAHTTTRRLLAGIRISSVDDGAGGSGGVKCDGGMVGGMRG